MGRIKPTEAERVWWEHIHRELVRYCQIRGFGAHAEISRRTGAGASTVRRWILEARVPLPRFREALNDLFLDAP